MHGRKFVPKDGQATKYQHLANSKWRTAATLKNLLATSERYIVRLTENLVRRSRITFWHRPRDHNTKFQKFKMADGRHFENNFIAINQEEITPFQWNLVYRRKFCSKRQSHDKVSKFSKFKMADGCHIEKSFLAISERYIVRLTENLVRRSRITFRHRPRDHNTKFRKFQMADGGHLKMILSLCLSRESYYLNEICYANSNFVPRRSYDKVSEFIKFKSHMWLGQLFRG